MVRTSADDLPATAKLHIMQEGLRSEHARGRVCEHRQIPLEVFNKWRERVIKAGKRALARGERAVVPGGRKFTADEKVGVILQAMMDGTSVSDVCQRHRISTKQYERWRSAFLEAGERALARPDWVPEFSGPAVAAIAAILVVVLLGVGWIVWRGARGKPILPRSEGQEGQNLDLPMRKVDLETGEVFVKTAGEWRTLESIENRWESPMTGAYTLAPAMICRSCGRVILAPDLPSRILEQGPAAVATAAPDYVCPECGESPYDTSGL